MQPSRWTHRVRLQDDTIEDAGWISHPFLLPPHSRITTGKESNDNNNRRFALHPTEPAVQIILNSSQGFAPTSLTLAAEACVVQWFIKVNGFADDRCSFSDPPNRLPQYLLYLIYIYIYTSSFWGNCPSSLGSLCLLSIEDGDWGQRGGREGFCLFERRNKMLFLQSTRCL